MDNNNKCSTGRVAPVVEKRYHSLTCIGASTGEQCFSEETDWIVSKSGRGEGGEASGVKVQVI